MIQEDFKKLRNFLMLDGIISIIVGLIIMFMPVRSAAFVAGIMGTAFIVIGLIRAISIFGNKEKTGWFKFGQLLIGLVYIVVGILIFADIRLATLTMLAIVGVMVGMTWFVEGIIQFSMISNLISGKVWAVISALINIIAGIVLLFTPLIGGLFVWSLLGIFFIVIGVFKIVQFFSLKA